MRFDHVVVGGGVVGLAAALAVRGRFPRASICVLEKETGWGIHQSGHNSGVIHSGIYYRPGSLKARLAKEGRELLLGFCREEGIEHSICGKLIVATRESQVEGLESLRERARANGIEARWLDPSEARDIEPHVRAAAALHVPSAGIVDFGRVCEAMVSRLASLDVVMRLGARVVRIGPRAGSMIVETPSGEVETPSVIACAGLQSDRLAAASGARPEARIIPFRGEYYDLSPRAASMVRGLIYPVPNPAFPFLGVHLTRTIDGSVHAGPNAVLSLAREGYRKSSFSAPDTLDTLSWPGFWRLAARHAGEGWSEVVRSLSRRAFGRSVRELVPEIDDEDLLSGGCGIRAQAVTRAGELVDDFMLIRSPGVTHVVNAPSPAATASLAIGRYIAHEIS